MAPTRTLRSIDHRKLWQAAPNAVASFDMIRVAGAGRNWMQNRDRLGAILALLLIILALAASACTAALADQATETPALPTLTFTPTPTLTPAPTGTPAPP